MAVNKQYVGARYVPKLADPILWSETTAYENMELVQDAQGNSWVSRKPVPEGTALEEGEYWVKFADFNAQLNNVKSTNEALSESVDTVTESLETYKESNNTAVEKNATFISNVYPFINEPFSGHMLLIADLNYNLQNLKTALAEALPGVPVSRQHVSVWDGIGTGNTSVSFRSKMMYLKDQLVDQGISANEVTGIICLLGAWDVNPANTPTEIVYADIFPKARLYTSLAFWGYSASITYTRLIKIRSLSTATVNLFGEYLNLTSSPTTLPLDNTTNILKYIVASIKNNIRISPLYVYSSNAMSLKISDNKFFVKLTPFTGALPNNTIWQGKEPIYDIISNSAPIMPIDMFLGSTYCFAFKRNDSSYPFTHGSTSVYISTVSAGRIGVSLYPVFYQGDGSPYATPTTGDYGYVVPYFTINTNI